MRTVQITGGGPLSLVPLSHTPGRHQIAESCFKSFQVLECRAVSVRQLQSWREEEAFLRRINRNTSATDASLDMSRKPQVTPQFRALMLGLSTNLLAVDSD